MRTLLAVSTILLLLAMPDTTQCQAGRVGIGTPAPLAPLHVDSTVLFTGSLNLAAPAPLPVTGPGTRMLWYPDYAAFRAGRVSGAQWDDIHIGHYSAALGLNTRAGGAYSFASGFQADASGQSSLALGYNPVASGFRSIAIGDSSIASGHHAVAIGKYSLANGYNSFAVGYNNLGGGDTAQWIPTDPLFEIGNGYPSARNNAMTVLKNGRVGLGYPQPKETLEVEGAVRLGTNADSAPAPGTIRWNAVTADFEGYNGSVWQSLTRAESWGNNAPIENAKLLADDGGPGDYFGYSVSISGDYAIIGAYANDDNGTSAGSAYIFVRSGPIWAQQAKLLADDGAEYDHFGYGVSISGDYAIIGAYGDDDNGPNAGSAYIFVRSGTNWTQQAKLLPTDGSEGDEFGRGVSISGDYALASARKDDDSGMDAGAAYIFVRSGTNWTQQAKLLASDGEENDRFGESVSISGEYAIIGAHLDSNENGTGSGSAYVFNRLETNWTQQAKLIPSDGSTDDQFGKSVSITGEYAITGAFRDDDNGLDAGSAYIFVRFGTNWTQQAKLLPADGAAEDWFGYAVSISGNYAIIGAYGAGAGSAYAFGRAGNTWTQRAKLLPSDGEANDAFGRSVSISGDYTVIGSSNDNVNGNSTGSAYVYKRN